MGGEGSGEGRCGLGNPEGRELGARAGGRAGGGEGERKNEKWAIQSPL